MTGQTGTSQAAGAEEVPGGPAARTRMKDATLEVGGRVLWENLTLSVEPG